MLVDDGATDDSGGVPFSLVVACGSDLAWYRQSLGVGQPHPESGCDVVVEVTFGCSAVHKYEDVTRGGRPVIVVRFSHVHRGREVDRFSE